MTRENHEKIMRDVIQSIRQISPNRPITIDGLGGGNIAMPELADTECTHSVRAYQPMRLTHYKASWCSETSGLSYQDYPGCEYAGKKWNKDVIQNHYLEWKQLADQGVAVHVGEMGCYDKVPQSSALKWFRDVFDTLLEYKWGFALWNFHGPFGVTGHRRPGTRFEKIGPYKIDIELWEMIKEVRDKLKE